MNCEVYNALICCAHSWIRALLGNRAVVKSINKFSLCSLEHGAGSGQMWPHFYKSPVPAAFT